LQIEMWHILAFFNNFFYILRNSTIYRIKNDKICHINNGNKLKFNLLMPINRMRDVVDIMPPEWNPE